jgi:hypothetical protein
VYSKRASASSAAAVARVPDESPEPRELRGQVQGTQGVRARARRAVARAVARRDRAVGHEAVREDRLADRQRRGARALAEAFGPSLREIDRERERHGDLDETLVVGYVLVALPCTRKAGRGMER